MWIKYYYEHIVSQPRSGLFLPMKKIGSKHAKLLENAEFKIDRLVMMRLVRYSTPFSTKIISDPSKWNLLPKYQLSTILLTFKHEWGALRPTKSW